VGTPPKLVELNYKEDLMMDFVGDEPKGVYGHFFRGQFRAEHFHIKSGRTKKSFPLNEVDFTNCSSTGSSAHVSE